MDNIFVGVALSDQLKTEARTYICGFWDVTSSIFYKYNLLGENMLVIFFKKKDMFYVCPNFERKFKSLAKNRLMSAASSLVVYGF
jgi:hypothetical protein